MDTTTTAKDQAAEKIRLAANEVAGTSAGDVLLISCSLFSDAEEALSICLRGRQRKRERATMILVTPGGVPDSAYRMMRALQREYPKGLTALIGGWCKSAGTMCLMATDELVMSDDAELGPLDIQLAKKDELGERDSGLVIGEALLNLQGQAYGLFDAFLMSIKKKSRGTVTFRAATQIASEITRGLFEPIYRQIDPLRIGDNARSLAVTEAYGRRLNALGGNTKPQAIEFLARNYPSHGFVIDRREAEELFVKVRIPKTAEQNLLAFLGKECLIPSDSPNIRYLDDSPGDTKNGQADTAGQVAAPKPKPKGRGTRRAQKNTSR